MTLNPGNIRRTFGTTFAASLALAAGSCKSAVDASPRVVSVETPLVWSGSRVVLTTPGLSGADTLPLVLIGNDTVTVRFAAPDSLVVTAPARPGVFNVLIGFAGRAPVAVGTVQLAGGYAGVWNVGPFGGRPQAWPGIPQSSFAIAMDSGVALVDPRVRTVRQVLSDSMSYPEAMTGLGPASGGRIATLSSRGRLLSVWPDPVSVDPDTGPTYGGRFAAQLAPGRWLVAYHHGVISVLRNVAGAWDTSTTAYHVEEPSDIAVSPRGDRAVVPGIDALGVGMPVFSAASASPAYLLTSFHEVWGAAFSADGDTLFVVGPRAAGAAPVLAALAASDGRVLKSAPAWGGTVHLMLDPGNRWIYLVGAVSYAEPGVQVVDRATFVPITTMHGQPGMEAIADVYPILSPPEHKLYLVDSCSFCSAATVPIYAFDLMP